MRSGTDSSIQKNLNSSFRQQCRKIPTPPLLYFYAQIQRLLIFPFPQIQHYYSKNTHRTLRMMVYLVEDSPLVRERLKDRISEVSSQIGILEAESAVDAVFGILSNQPDIVVLDLKLKGGCGSGLDVLKEIKRRGSTSCVVVLTNQAEAAYRSKCLSMGAEFFFDKMAGFDGVIAEIKKRV